MGGACALAGALLPLLVCIVLLLLLACARTRARARAHAGVCVCVDRLVGVRQVVTMWVGQWFWNVLDFPDIVRVTVMAAICGPHWVALLCTALLRQLTPALVRANVHGSQCVGDVLRGPVPCGSVDWPALSRHMQDMDSRHPWLPSALP